jgi:hypothetical protein
MSNNVLNQPSKLVDLLYFKKALGLSKKTSIDSKILTEKFKIGYSRFGTKIMLDKELVDKLAESYKPTPKNVDGLNKYIRFTQDDHNKINKIPDILELLTLISTNVENIASKLVNHIHPNQKPDINQT